MTTTPNPTAEQIVQSNPEIKNAVLAAIIPGAKSDREAVKRYREARDAVVAALPYLEKHFTRVLLSEGAPSEGSDTADDVRRAVRMWAERFIIGDVWDSEDVRDLEAALSCVVEASPTAHDRRRATLSEEQIERAARAYDPEAWAAYDRLVDEAGEPSPELVVEYSIEKARTILTAAGVAPQEPRFEAIVAAKDAWHLASDVWQGRAERAEALLHSSLAPEKVAEVLNRHILGKANGGTASKAWVDCSCGERIERFGWTRDQVYSLAQMHQAAALCEAYKEGKLT